MRNSNYVFARILLGFGTLVTLASTGLIVSQPKSLASTTSDYLKDGTLPCPQLTATACAGVCTKNKQNVFVCPAPTVERVRLPNNYKTPEATTKGVEKDKTYFEVNNGQIVKTQCGTLTPCTCDTNVKGVPCVKGAPVGAIEQNNIIVDPAAPIKTAKEG